jgi:hypothetical protein
MSSVPLAAALADRYRIERLGQGGWPPHTWRKTFVITAGSRSKCSRSSWPPPSAPIALVVWVRQYPELAPLRADPRYAALDRQFRF